jgi:hypothetical protein
MTARDKTFELIRAAEGRGLSLGFDDANDLRRAEITLHRWAEGMCGGNNWGFSFVIEREEETDIPYMLTSPHKGGNDSRYRIPDRERGALRRVQAICERIGAHYYHQTDPRGCALYISTEPLPDNNYTIGVACSIR